MMARIFKPRRSRRPSVMDMSAAAAELPYFPAEAPPAFTGPPEPILALLMPPLADLADVVDRPTDADLRRPTPCEGWDVERLRDHVLGWLQFFAAALTDPDGAAARPDPDAYRADADDRAPGDVVRGAAATIADAVRGGVQHRRVAVSRSVMDGGAVLAMLLGEYVVHGCDLARSLGVGWTPAPAACEASLAFLRSTVRPEYRGGDGGMFGAERVAAPDAPPLDRLLAFAGRP